MLKNCGAVKAENPCHCEHVAPHAIQTQAIDPKNLLFAGHRWRDEGGGLSMKYFEELDSLQRMAALFKNHPDYAAPETFLENLKEMVRSGQIRLFEGLH